MDAGRLSVVVTHADGRASRWGADERDPAAVPQGLRFRTTMPGGFKDAQLTLTRRIDVPYPDLHLFDTVAVHGPGGETAFEGRVHALPRSHSTDSSVTVQLVGWAAHLKDDASFREIYVDQDLSRWQPSSAERKMSLLPSWQVAESSPGSRAGRPTVITELQEPWSPRGLCEATYYGNGLPIGGIYFEWERSQNIGAVDTGWHWAVYLADDDLHTAYNATSELREGNLTGRLAFNATTGTRKYATVQMRYDFLREGGAQYVIKWANLVVYGRHGLTGRELAPGGPWGAWASDILRHCLPLAAPLLDTSGIEQTSFPIPHMAFADPVAAEDVVLACNTFHLWEWGVWERRQFVFRPPDPNRVVWQARLSEGAHLDLEGDQADDVFNGVIVQFTHPTLGERTAGPPGATAHVTSSLLQSTDPFNPATLHGIPSKYAVLRLSSPTTDQGALQIGAVYLAERALPARRGTITLTGTATHPVKGDMPVWAIRAGDSIRVSDHPSDQPRRIIETQYTHDTRTVECMVGTDIAKLDALLERIGVSLIGIA